MKTIFLLTGKTKNSYLLQGVREYHKRIINYIAFEIIEIPDLKNTRNLSQEQVKEKEGNLILNEITVGDVVVLLDERGKEMSSREFSSFIESQMIGSVKRLVFIVGGAYGFSNKVTTRSNFRLSLSRMTFPHQLVRLFFLEQFYRAMTIIKGEPYHND